MENKSGESRWGEICPRFFQKKQKERIAGGFLPGWTKKEEHVRWWKVINDVSEVKGKK